MKSRIVFYHHNCPDGFGAAYAAWKRFGDTAQYVACRHGVENDLPPCAGKEVFILDYCFNAETLRKLGDEASQVVVWDHHATWVHQLQEFSHPNVQLNLVMEHSGAVLAWKYFNPGVPVPIMLQHVEDRDLWRWEMPSSEAFLAALDAMGFDFYLWDSVAHHQPGTAEYENFVNAGEVMVLQFKNFCRELSIDPRPIRFQGQEGLVLNLAGKVFTSYVGNTLAKQCGTFALLWYMDSATTIRCSLRSVDEFSVLAAAEAYGGGGHPQAAGFSLSLDQLPALLAGKL